MAGRPVVRRREEGAVLVITLIIVMLMMVLVSDSAMIARIELEATRNSDLDLRLEYACKAGYQIAETYLRQDAADAPEVDSLLEEWAQGPIVESFNVKELAGADSYGSLDVFEGEEGDPDQIDVRIWIEDEESKFPLALLKVGSEATRQQRVENLANVIRTFREDTSFEVDDGTARNYARLIFEYLQRTDENPGAFGPTPRPATKSGSIIKTTDLALIPGLPRDLVYDLYDPVNDRIVFGLTRYLSPWSNLAINVNTADRAALSGLFRPRDRSYAGTIFDIRERGSEELGEELELYRQNQRDNANSGFTPEGGEEEEEPAVGVFSTVDEVREKIPQIRPDVFNEARTRMVVNSSTFSIYVTAKIMRAKRTRRWVVRRDGLRYVPILTEEVSYPFLREGPPEGEGEELGF